MTDSNLTQDAWLAEAERLIDEFGLNCLTMKGHEESAAANDRPLCADCTTEHACKNRLDVPRPCGVDTPMKGGA